MNNDPLFRAIKQHAKVLQEYYLLGLKPNLDREEEDRIEKILQLAENDELLNSILIEIDDIIAQRKDLTSEEFYEEYRDQISWMKEYLIQNQHTNDWIQQHNYDRERCKQVQALLIELGFYSGPQDGLLGRTTLAAIEKFQIQESLKVDGVPGDNTFSKLTNRLNL